MISIIVATDNDLLIGKKDSKNGMPWNNFEDLNHFKETTINKTIVMGITTYNAIGRPLPNRQTVVLTHRKDFKDDRVIICDNLEALVNKYRQENKDLYIAGGASVYKQSLPLVDELLISRIPGQHEGETYFPNFDDYGFELVEKKEFETFTLETYRKGN